MTVQQVTGCAPEESDLEQVAKCFFSGRPSDPWKLLSKESQAEVGPRDEFNSRFWEGAPAKSVKVLGIDSRDGQVFGRVEVVFSEEVLPESSKERPRCVDVRTMSWTQEGGAWRRVTLPKQRELVAKQFQNGDYSGALATAERWLSFDPFSEDAYRQLVFSLARGARRSQSTRSVPDVLRAALAVNPHDSTALFTAISWTEDLEISEALFERLASDDCAREDAAFNLAMKMPARRRLAFLEKAGTSSAALQMVLVKTLVQVGDAPRLASVLTSDVDTAIRAHLEASDGAFAASWSTSMGEAWLTLKNREAAKAWASYGATKDPTSAEVARLLRRVKG